MVTDIIILCVYEADIYVITECRRLIGLSAQHSAIGLPHAKQEVQVDLFVEGSEWSLV